MPVCFALELKAFKKHFCYIFLVGFFHSGNAGKPRSIKAQLTGHLTDANLQLPPMLSQTDIF